MNLSMFNGMKSIVYSIFWLNLINSLKGFDIELTIVIPANQRECFHQTLEIDKSIEVEYEVISGGEFDINFWFYSPTNRVLKSDYKKRDGHEVTKLTESGDYRFCFDNSFSRFSQKQVYFSLRPIFEAGEAHQQFSTQEEWMKQIDKDNLGELQNKVQDLKDQFQRIWDQMEKAQRYQSIFKNYEVHDRLIVEQNFERVNFWSIVHLVIMLTVTIIQVITIRSLFESKSAVGKFLRGKK